MNQQTFSSGQQVIAAFGSPLTARRKTKIRIREVEGDVELLTRRNGDVLRAEQGLDYMVLPESGDPYPCKIDIFHRSWEEIPEEPGLYRRSALAKVIPIPEGCTVTLETLEGHVVASYPDYIAIGIDGEVYTNSKEWAEANLEFI